MAEEINIPEPNYNPTPEQISEITNGLSARKYDFIEFETTGMITSDAILSFILDVSNGDYSDKYEYLHPASALIRTPMLRIRMYRFPPTKLNLPMLNGQLVYSSNLGIAINRKGEQISEDNTEDWLIISSDVGRCTPHPTNGVGKGYLRKSC